MCHINTHTLFLNHLMESYIRHGPFNVFKGEVYFLKNHSTVINLSKFNIATIPSFTFQLCHFIKKNVLYSIFFFFFTFSTGSSLGFSGGSAVKNPPENAGNMSPIPASGRSAGEGNGNPLQHSCLGHPMNRGAWRAIVHGVAGSWTRLSDKNNNNRI